MTPLTARLACARDLEFVARDGQLPLELVLRKIRWQEVFVAERRRQPVGSLRLDFLWARIPYISNLDVPLAEYPREVTRALLDFTLRFLRQRGYEQLLSSSRIGESPTPYWHQQLGFVPCGTIAIQNHGAPGETFYRRPLRNDLRETVIEEGPKLTLNDEALLTDLEQTACRSLSATAEPVIDGTRPPARRPALTRS